MVDKKPRSMKSHNYHMLMQQVLNLFLQGLMVVEPWMAIVRLNCVFWWVCVKVWNLFEITNLQEDVAITFSILKKKFLPTFFDVMMHYFCL